MTDSINHEGLARLVQLELSRLGVTDRAEAHRILKGRVGVYDIDGSAIDAGIAAYFSGSTAVRSRH